MTYLDVNDLSQYPINKVARLMNEKMRSEMDYSARWYYRDTEPNLSEYGLWGQMDMSDGYGTGFMTLSNNQAVRSILSSYEESGDVEFGSDFMRIRIWRVGKHVARVYGDPDDLEDMPIINGEFTDAFWSFYDDIVDHLNNYPLLDDEDYYEREHEAKREAFDNEWTYVLRSIDDSDANEDWFIRVNDAMNKVWYILDGGEVNPVTGNYNEIEVDEDSAYVDSDDIYALLEHFGLVTSEVQPSSYSYRGVETIYTAHIRTQEELAQIEAMKYQEAFDFEGATE